MCGYRYEGTVAREASDTATTETQHNGFAPTRYKCAPA